MVIGGVNMSPETKKYTTELMQDIIIRTDFLKNTDIDQFTIMRLALIHSLAVTIFKHLEV